MAKRFCGNCGAELDDNTVFCGNCGAKNEETGGAEETAAVEGGNFEGNDGASEGGSTARGSGLSLKYIGVIVLVIITAILASHIIKSYSGYEKLIEKTVKCIKKDNPKGIVSMISDLAYYSVSGEDDLEDYYYDYYSDFIDDISDNFQDELGKRYKIRYQITDVDMPSEEELEYVIEAMEESVPEYNSKKLKSMIAVEVELIAEKGRKEATESIDMVAVKEGSSWKLLMLD